tara:strand:+ start:3165 stop:5480 length:2316 start_codon:yes stop_codon:yes gene_type:complete
MKNNFFIIFICLFFSKVFALENLDIKSKKITIDKKKEVTTFQNEVIIKDEMNNIIKSDYVLYDNKLKRLDIKGNVIVFTAEGYSIKSENLILDEQKNLLFSKSSSTITDVQKNEIFLENFEYEIKEKKIKSIGNIQVNDRRGNTYKFSQIYIDEKSKELFGTDAKAFLNDKNFKINEDNKPRILSNAISIKENQSNFIKSVFTVCDYRENDKCPAWELRAKNIKHDNIKKTIYYDNVVIKVYDIPILFLPKLAHPDPTVKRRSGFLIPSYSDTKNLGTSLNIPYFWAINDDKDLTIKNKLFASEHPLILGEYRQAFLNSDLVLDFGYTGGYKKASSSKKPGDKSHFFSNFKKKYFLDENKEANLEVNFQSVSNKKYLKLYKIESTLIDNYETSSLKNFINYDYFDNEKDQFFNLHSSIFTDISDSYNDKYEYILPELNFNKNLYSNNFGYGSFNTNMKMSNYDTNKSEKFFVNDLDWTLEKNFGNLPYDGKFITNLKNVNYEAKNVDKLKRELTHEFFGAIGYLASIDLIKESSANSNQLLTPKILFKYAPNHMKKDTGDHNLHNKNIFNLDRLESSSSIEGGTSLTYGFDYKNTFKNDQEFNFSIGQIINEKKVDKRKPDTSSLDKRFSDVVGDLNLKKNNLELNYKYSLDQNFKEMNYSEIETKYSLGNMSFNIDYLKEEKITDPKEYIKSSIEIKQGDNGLFTFDNKRNVITNSSEYYNLSYEYINDCLRAGLVYRREFYNDSELEAENSLLFKITLSPFGDLSSPKF